MLNSKKTLLGATLAAVLSTSAFADASYVSIGAGQATILTRSTTVVDLGFGKDFIWDNGFLFGIGADVEDGSMPTTDHTNLSTNFYGVTADIRAGYVPVKDLSVYAIGSGTWQAISSSTGAVGFGGGAGIGYAVTNSFAVSAEYRTYSITSAKSSGSLDYTYSNAILNFKYTW